MKDNNSHSFVNYLFFGTAEEMSRETSESSVIAKFAIGPLVHIFWITHSQYIRTATVTSFQVRLSWRPNCCRMATDNCLCQNGDSAVAALAICEMTSRMKIVLSIHPRCCGAGMSWLRKRFYKV
ncbi:hypothetical protein CEXT_18631 [Caerostris extrusa]|uniref:Uncharacterized protein n=1 Tax=Caerostris extrusa TaxID=172846 RepID=A0AAV4Q5Y9_CAEEX|nr:hypothetical protein CEXT_18631 [Caerostris extrusa]